MAEIYKEKMRGKPQENLVGRSAGLAKVSKMKPGRRDERRAFKTTSREAETTRFQVHSSLWSMRVN